MQHFPSPSVIEHFLLFLLAPFLTKRKNFACCSNIFGRPLAATNALIKLLPPSRQHYQRLLLSKDRVDELEPRPTPLFHALSLASPLLTQPQADIHHLLDLYR
jgi:hypothetical protein